MLNLIVVVLFSYSRDNNLGSGCKKQFVPNAGQAHIQRGTRALNADCGASLGSSRSHRLAILAQVGPRAPQSRSPGIAGLTILAQAGPTVPKCRSPGSAGLTILAQVGPTVPQSRDCGTIRRYRHLVQVTPRVLQP